MKFSVANTPSKLKLSLFLLRRCVHVSVDLETDGLDWRKDDIVGIGFYGVLPSGKPHAFHIPIAHRRYRNLKRRPAQRLLRPFFADKRMKICMHNGNFDRHFLESYGIPVKNFWMDTQVGYHLYDDNAKVALKDIIPEEFGVTADKFKNLFNKRNPIWDSDPKEYSKYLLQDVEYTWKLAQIVHEGLGKQKLLNYFFKIEMPTLDTIFDMECRGMLIDQPRLEKYGDELDISIDTHLKKIYRIVGDPDFNPNSAPQISRFVFADLGATPVKTSRATGNPSCDVEAMEIYSQIKSNKRLAEFAEAILAYRKVKKLKSTYVKGILDRIVDGKINPRFLMLTVTGRLCVSGDTILNTDKGDLEISKLDLCKGTEYSILTHRGRYKRILNKYYKGKELMYLVRLYNGSEIKCTAGHRFLTSKGWKHLYDIEEKEEIYTHLHNNLSEGLWEKGEIQDSKNSGRDLLHSNISCGGAYLGEGYGEIPTVQQPCQPVETSLGRETQTSSEGIEEQALCKGNEREPEREERSRYNFAEVEIKEIVIGRKDSPENSKTFEDKRILCSEKYRLPQFKERFSSSSKNAGVRFSLLRDIKNLFSRYCEKGKTLSRRSRIFLPILIQSLLKGNSDRMVHKGSGKDSQLLEERWEGSKGSYLLGRESLRISPINDSSGRQYSSSKTIQFLRALLSRLLLPPQTRCGAGRGVSQDRQSNQTEGFEEKQNPQRGRDKSSKVSERFCLERSTQDCFSDQTAFIESIEPVGVLDVWDIEVEDDHSYVAQGFVNHNSSRDPNAQNLPRKSEIRACFIPPKGYSMIVVDYSQIELRVVAHLSGDKVLTNAYKTGKDIHQQTADLVCDGDRDAAKVVNFGLIYKMSAKALAKTLKISLRKAERFIKAYFKSFSGVVKWQDKTVRVAKKFQRTRTMLGRPRRLLNIRHKGYKQQFEEREGINHPVQGTAGELCKLAMIDINKHKMFKLLGGQLLSQVHDELICIAPTKHANKARRILIDVMETAFSRRGINMSVPIIAEGNTGINWLQAK